MKASIFFSYVFNMPYHVIWSDVMEYINLVKDYKKVDAKCKKGYEELKHRGRCVTFVPVALNGRFDKKKRVVYCENYFNKKCDVSECPNQSEHNRYWRLMDRRKDLMIKKAEFWDAKFQNVR